jgi:UDP-N-acetylmuramoyl-L-alanyl-D-glutamate--2,6-diaminopimelate ligase
MMWTDVLAEVVTLERSGPAEAEIGGVQYDSRRVEAGDMFVAMRGGSTDGNRFVRSAIGRGAAAIVTDSREVFAGLGADVPAVLVEHGRRALAEVSAAFFDHPERKLKISAVTGTNGKTTTAFLLEQMLASVGRKCVLVGTIEMRIAGEVRPSEHTTPESRDLLALFADGVRAGCTEVVMEMSSHALEQERVWGIPVDVAIFTNLTQDHLDFHGTMEAYFEAKAKLFHGVGCGPPRVAVINDDDWWGAERLAYAVAAESTLMRYAAADPDSVEYHATNIKRSAGQTIFQFVTPSGSIELRSPLTGSVNVSNLLAASCAALARGLRLEEIASAVEGLKQVPGRFEVVPGSREAGFTVVVDYAHTDDALKNLIELGRGLVGEHGGRVIAMFGCGGDRDKTKRPKMGRVAGAESDLVVVTSDNPRSEDPMEIINEALLGVRETNATFVVEEDRRAAIEVAIRAAKPGDIVLLAGKGHEKEQIFADGPVPFDDVAEAARILREITHEDTR